MMNSTAVIQDVSNLSDHRPILIEVDLAVDRVAMPSNRRIQRQRVLWAKAKDGHLLNNRKVLRRRLKSIVLPVAALTSQSMPCGNTGHRNASDKNTNGITNVCHNSGLATTPRVMPAG
jgi:hypothetical protein